MSYTPKIPGRGKLHRAVLTTAGAACLLLGTAVSANAWIIDFEGLTQTNYPGQAADTSHSLIIDDEYAAGGIPGGGSLTATFSAFTADGHNASKPWTWSTARPAVLFDTRPPATGGDPDLNAPFCLGPAACTPGANPMTDINPKHVLIIHEHPGECDGITCNDPDDEASNPAGRFFIEFNQDVVLETIDFFDIEHSENGQTIQNKIVLYDGAGMVLPGNFWTPDTGGDRQWDQVDFGGTGGVRKVEIRMDGSGALDNIKGSFAQVPEPTSAGLFAVGMVAFGALRRRKRADA